MKASAPLFFLLLLLRPLASHGQAEVSVTPGEKLRELSEIPLGLNLNTWMDDQANRPASAAALASALAASGLHFLRFPGGEKSDAYMWATPPEYSDPSTATVFRRGPNEFPYAYPPIFDSLTNRWTLDNYDFDEFMADCRAAGGEPVIAVALDNIYKPAEPGGSTLTRAQTLELAVEWVRYANVTKKYGVKYWTLGNETWNTGGYNGSVPDFATYGADVRDFAAAMKAVDPSIRIGINADSYVDFDRALDSCAAKVDFLDVHSYPCYGFTSYTDYLRKNIGATGIIEEAELAILYGKNAEERQHLFISMTETSAYGFMDGSSWEQGNNLGQALANFDLFAQLAADDRVRFAQYWNTRWINEDTGISHGTDLLTAENELNATGRLLSLLSHELLDEMVTTTSDGRVRTFATLASGGEALTVFLLNKDTVATPTELTLDNYIPTTTTRRSEFRGDGPTDTNPVLVDLADIPVSENVVNLILPPSSVTVLRFSGRTEACATNHIAAGGFERQTIAPWEAESSGSAFAGRIDGASVFDGAGAGYVGEGKASIFQLVPDLLANTDYLLMANVMYHSDNPDLPPLILTVTGTGSEDAVTAVTASGGNYETVSLPFTTGPADSPVRVTFSVADAQTYGWIDEVSLRCNAENFALPVELLSFRGSDESEGNVLEWTVARERDLSGYVVESSPRGREWTELVTVPASAETSPTKYYTYKDARHGIRSYRLRMTDTDGTVTYSHLIRIGNAEGAPATLHPNPTDGQISLPDAVAGESYRITNATGRGVAEGTLSGSTTLIITELPAGLYYLTLSGGGRYRVVKR